MKTNFKKAACGAALAASLAVGGALLPATALADSDPYGRGYYFLEYSYATTGHSTAHQRKGYDANGFAVWRTGAWAANGAFSRANVYGLYSANTYSALFK